MKIVEMKLVFNAGFAALRKIVARLDRTGEWRELELGYQYRSETGAILNYFPATGSILFQGPESARLDMRTQFELLLAKSAADTLSIHKALETAMAKMESAKTSNN